MVRWAWNTWTPVMIRASTGSDRKALRVSIVLADTIGLHHRGPMDLRSRMIDFAAEGLRFDRPRLIGDDGGVGDTGQAWIRGGPIPKYHVPSLRNGASSCDGDCRTSRTEMENKLGRVVDALSGSGRVEPPDRHVGSLNRRSSDPVVRGCGQACRRSGGRPAVRCSNVAARFLLCAVPRGMDTHPCHRDRK